ncbi:hypothetical protein HHI31_04440 [Campylobacter fetus subsp. venerealis]|nr:hypothetical protein HHI31_04440 [Campylobacter fetus subsp. venerealis]
MATSKAELKTIKQLFSTLSNDGKKILKSIKSKEKLKQNFIFIKKLRECLHYKSAYFVKNGKVHLPTTFTCQHKILDDLQEMQENIKLDDILNINCISRSVNVVIRHAVPILIV